MAAGFDTPNGTSRPSAARRCDPGSTYLTRSSATEDGTDRGECECGLPNPVRNVQIGPCV